MTLEEVTAAVAAGERRIDPPGAADQVRERARVR